MDGVEPSYHDHDHRDREIRLGFRSDWGEIMYDAIDEGGQSGGLWRA